MPRKEYIILSSNHIWYTHLRSTIEVVELPLFSSILPCQGGHTMCAQLIWLATTLYRGVFNAITTIIIYLAIELSGAPLTSSIFTKAILGSLLSYFWWSPAILVPASSQRALLNQLTSHHPQGEKNEDLPSLEFPDGEIILGLFGMHIFYSK